MSQKGFSQVILLGIVAVLVLIGTGGVLVFREKKLSSHEKTVQQDVSSEDMASPIEPIPSPAQSIQPAKPKMQPALQPTAPPPSPTKVIEDKPPVLKNLGINIELWNKQTNLAGNLIFTSKVLYTDANIKNEKVFAEFGEFEHVINNPGRSVEYWFFLQPGTKIHAAADGIVHVFYIEHTKDWGINISPRQGSMWFVGHEHLINLVVKEGDIVRAGDVIGDAMAHKSFGVDLGFTELAVWTGGRNGIYKYCPFDFLDESLKLMYEQKINQLAKDWEEFIGKDVYKQEEWVAPGCVLDKIKEQ